MGIRHLWLLIAIAIALSGVMHGCALPDYHLPSGFSSTYYRHLQQSQLPPPVEQMVETEPASRWSWRN